AALSCASAGTDVMVANSTGITRENFITHPFSGGACINAQALLQPICISWHSDQSLPSETPKQKGAGLATHPHLFGTEPGRDQKRRRAATA
ncbi:hypothetical protein, partial [Erythrobacter donghaensis]|uniref:hypothetical protein n=1 Tax=Erythrobacter donghaensis TaxID=267135 RepID=UPI001E57E5EC